MLSLIYEGVKYGFSDSARWYYIHQREGVFIEAMNILEAELLAKQYDVWREGWDIGIHANDDWIGVLGSVIISRRKKQNLMAYHLDGTIINLCDCVIGDNLL